MDKISAIGIYARAFRSSATQLRDLRLAREWMESMQDWRSATPQELETHAKMAATWASAGFLPREAAPLIASGMTPEMAMATDPQTDAERMAYLANRIEMLGNDDQR